MFNITKWNVILINKSLIPKLIIKNLKNNFETLTFNQQTKFIKFITTINSQLYVPRFCNYITTTLVNIIPSLNNNLSSGILKNIMSAIINGAIVDPDNDILIHINSIMYNLVVQTPELVDINMLMVYISSLGKLSEMKLTKNFEKIKICLEKYFETIQKSQNIEKYYRQANFQIWMNVLFLMFNTNTYNELMLMDIVNCIQENMVFDYMKNCDKLKLIFDTLFENSTAITGLVFLFKLFRSQKKQIWNAKHIVYLK